MARKSKAAVKPRAQENAKRSRLVTLLACLSLATAITAIDLVWVHGLWSGLPGHSLASIDWDAVNRHRARVAGTAREGLVLAINSDQFTAALQNRSDLRSILAETRGRSAHVHQTQLGRLHLAALVMLQLERAGTPASEWWPSVQGYLTGLEEASFDHLLMPLLSVETDIFRSVGLRPGVAGQMALYTVGNAHLPFVQFMVERLERLAQARRDAGDQAGAELCARIAPRLARQWTLADGPPALRLLSAELLADSIERQGRAETDSDAVTIAAKCRAWRRVYREAATAVPQVPAVLRLGENVPPLSDTPRLTASLARAGWMAAAVVALGLLTLLAAPLLFVARGDGNRATRTVLAALTAGVVLAITGWVCAAALPDLVSDDFRRLGSDDLGLPRLPLVAAGVGIAFALTAGLATIVGQPGRWNRCSGMARTVLTTWLVCAVLLLVADLLAGRDVADHERLLAMPPAMQLRAVADPNAEGLLDELRAWTP